MTAKLDCLASQGSKLHRVQENDILSKSMEGLTAEFDRIQKSLTDYLDTKRSAFPRFYLISDDELLSILGTSDPKARVCVRVCVCVCAPMYTCQTSIAPMVTMCMLVSSTASSIQHSQSERPCSPTCSSCLTIARTSSQASAIQTGCRQAISSGSKGMTAMLQAQSVRERERKIQIEIG